MKDPVETTVTRGIDAHRFHCHLQCKGEHERLNEDPLNPLTITPLRATPVHLLFGGVKVGDFCVWKTESDTGFEARPRLIADLVTIRFPLAGQLVRKDGPSELVIDKGQGVIIPYQEMEYERSSERVNIISCTMSTGSLLIKANALLGDCDFNVSSFQSRVHADIHRLSMFRTALVRLHRELMTSEPNSVSYPIIEEQLIFFFLSCWPRTANRRASVSHSGNSVMRIALEFIEANIANPITVSDVAAAAGISVRNLQTIFRKHKDCTPLQYIIDQRLDRVHVFLMQDSATGYIAQIARAWGFEHPADFTRRYRARFGETPNQTRRRQ